MTAWQAIGMLAAGVVGIALFFVILDVLFDLFVDDEDDFDDYGW